MYLLFIFYFWHYKDCGMNYHNLQSFHTINRKTFPDIDPIKDKLPSFFSQLYVGPIKFSR